MSAPDDQLVTLAVFDNEIEAHLLVARLQDHGIDARATGEFTSAFRAEAPGGVSVVVKQGSLPEAQAVLAEVKQHAKRRD